MIYCHYCEKCKVGFESRGRQQVKCPKCKSHKNVYRDYQAENVSVSEGIKTLGSLSDKNADNMSDSQKFDITLKNNKHLIDRANKNARTIEGM